MKTAEKILMGSLDCQRGYIFDILQGDVSGCNAQCKIREMVGMKLIDVYQKLDSLGPSEITEMIVKHERCDG